MKDTRRKYTQEFKEKVVREHIGGASLTELSKMYGIAPSTLGTWFSNLKDKLEAEVVEVMVDPEVVEELEEAKAKIEILEMKLEDRETEITRLNKKIKELPASGEVGGLLEKVDSLTFENDLKEKEIIKLEKEVQKLRTELAEVKEEAIREFKTLKEAIGILTKKI